MCKKAVMAVLIKGFYINSKFNTHTKICHWVIILSKSIEAMLSHPVLKTILILIKLQIGGKF